MKIIACIMLGYLLGSLSPAALISKVKQKNLKTNGTGNLGATNTALVFGKRFGVLVMIFDIGKSCLAVCCARRIAVGVEGLTMLAGASAVFGHCFPFYLKFKGGKGLAAFGGVVLAHSPRLFLFLLITGAIIVVITNHGAMIAYYAAVIFPAYVCMNGRSTSAKVVSILLSLFLMALFFPQLKQELRGQVTKPREFIKEQALKEAEK